MFLKPNNILSFLLIILCVYGNLGFYHVNYCCGDCQKAGISAVLNDECHKIHQTEHHRHECCEIEHEDADCSHQCVDDMACSACCSITSYKIDIYISDFKNSINVPMLDLPYPLRHLYDKELTASSSFRKHSDTYFLPAHSSRERLALHATFLI